MSGISFVIGEVYKYSPPVQKDAFESLWYVPGVVRITGRSDSRYEYEVLEGMSDRLPHHKFDTGSMFADWLKPYPDYSEAEIDIEMSFDDMMSGLSEEVEARTCKI